MERTSNTIFTAITNSENKIVNDGDLPKPKKKRGAMHLLRVALYMLRRNSDKSKASMQVDIASKGPWKKVLGSMRPLHVQSNQIQPPLNDIPGAAAPMIEHFEEVFTPPLSPAPSKSLTSSCAPCSEDGMSQYASALNLQELDTGTEDIEECDVNGGDEMIDVKAEEFINQFYQQMRIQNVEYKEGYNRGLRHTS